MQDGFDEFFRFLNFFCSRLVGQDVFSSIPEVRAFFQLVFVVKSVESRSMNGDGLVRVGWVDEGV